MISRVLQKNIGAVCRLKASCVLLLWQLLLTGCKSDIACPEFDAPLPGANAGCLIVQDARVVMVRDYTGRISLPGGTHEAGESAQCTAFRETYEETGLRVQVGELVKVFGNGFHLFACRASERELKPAMRTEIFSAAWYDAAELKQTRARFVDQQLWLGDLLEQQESEYR